MEEPGFVAKLTIQEQNLTVACCYRLALKNKADNGPRYNESSGKMTFLDIYMLVSRWQQSGTRPTANLSRYTEGVLSNEDLDSSYMENIIEEAWEAITSSSGVKNGGA